MLKRYWENWDAEGMAARHDEYWLAEEGPWRDALVAQLRKHIMPDQLITEIGCGTGLIYQALLDAGLCTSKTYVGGDISQTMLARARNRAPDVDWKTLDIFKIDLPDASQPVVLNIHVLQHLPDYKEALQELLRITKNVLFISSWFNLTKEDTIDYRPGWFDLYGYSNCYSLPRMIHFLSFHSDRVASVETAHFGGRGRLFLLKINMR